MKHTTRPFIRCCLATVAASTLLLTSLPAAAAGAADTFKPVPQRVKPAVQKGDAAKPYIGGTDDDSSIRRKKLSAVQQPAAGKLVPNTRKSAQYNPKEVPVDKRQ